MAADPGRLERLLRPKSVVVVGGAEAERVVEQLDLLGFDGDIWPVNPNRDEIGGRRCLRSIDEVPGSPDAAFVAVPAEQTPEVASALAALSAGAIVVYSSGFAESGDQGLQQELIEAAGGVPVIGPNTYGFVNALDQTAIWPDVHGMEPVERGVGIITQSGNIGINMTMARRGLDIGLLVTAGNLADLGISDYMAAMIEDERITAIGVQLESLSSPDTFGAVVIDAAKKGIPIVALKMGTSAKGSLITSSHTGAMAGESDVYDAFFAHYGVTSVSTIPSFLETLKLAGKVSSRSRVVSLSASGGEAAHVADLAAFHGVDLPKLTEGHAAQVRETVHHLVNVSNPMDYHTLSWGDGASQAKTFGTLVAGPFDVAMLVLDFPGGDVPEDWWTACQAFATAAAGRPGLVVATLPENMPEEAQTRLRDMGLIPMLGLAETMEALGSMRSESSDVSVLQAPASASVTPLDEHASKAVLQAAGIDIPIGEVLADPTSGDVPYPRTVKVLGLDHKAAVGAVAVGLDNPELVKERTDTMPETDRYLVEETVQSASSEVMLGLRATDLGWMVTIASGGTDVERLDKRQHLMIPTTAKALGEALSRVGVDDFDPEHLLDVVDKMLEARQKDRRIMEIEINPLVMASGRAVALDAMVNVS